MAHTKKIVIKKKVNKYNVAPEGPVLAHISVSRSMKHFGPLRNCSKNIWRHINACNVYAAVHMLLGCC